MFPTRKIIQWKMIKGAVSEHCAVKAMRNAALKGGNGNCDLITYRPLSAKVNCSPITSSS